MISSPLSHRTSYFVTPVENIYNYNGGEILKSIRSTGYHYHFSIEQKILYDLFFKGSIQHACAILKLSRLYLWLCVFVVTKYLFNVTFIACDIEQKTLLYLFLVFVIFCLVVIDTSTFSGERAFVFQL